MEDDEHIRLSIKRLHDLKTDQHYTETRRWVVRVRLEASRQCPSCMPWVSDRQGLSSEGQQNRKVGGDVIGRTSHERAPSFFRTEPTHGVCRARPISGSRCRPLRWCMRSGSTLRLAFTMVLVIGLAANGAPVCAGGAQLMDTEPLPTPKPPFPQPPAPEPTPPIPPEPSPPPRPQWDLAVVSAGGTSSDGRIHRTSSLYSE